jgi:hypothetical protein
VPTMSWSPPVSSLTRTRLLLTWRYNWTCNFLSAYLYIISDNTPFSGPYIQDGKIICWHLS